jgi:hypothetical protein
MIRILRLGFDAKYWRSDYHVSDRRRIHRGEELQIRILIILDVCCY